MNRCLGISDKNGSAIGEEDVLEIDVSSVDSSFFRSNLGELCERENISKIIITLKNCHPVLKVEYSFEFIPSNRKETLNDVFFLKYVAKYSENKTKKPSIPIDDTLALETEFKTKDNKVIVSNDTIKIPKDSVNPKLFKPEFWNHLQSIPNFEFMVVNLSRDGFHLKTKYHFIKSDGTLLSNKEIHKLEDDGGDSFVQEPFIGYCLPHKNHSEFFIKNLSLG